MGDFDTQPRGNSSRSGSFSATTPRTSSSSAGTPRSVEGDVLAWREEEELRLASQKSYKGGTGSLSIIYESESEGSTTDASDSSGEEEHYNRRKKKKGSQTKLSSSSSGSLDPVIIVEHSELLPDTDNNTGSSVSSVRSADNSLGPLGYPSLPATDTTIHSSSVTNGRRNSSGTSKPMLGNGVLRSSQHSVHINPIDMRALKESLEEIQLDERKQEAVRLQKRELALLLDKREMLKANIMLSKSGYNDVGTSMDDLDSALKKLNNEIGALEQMLAVASPAASPRFVLSPHYSPGGANSPSRKFSQELKIELRQLDPRVAVYTSPRRQSKGNVWQLDVTETETERERRGTERFDKVQTFLKKKGVLIDYGEIRLVDKVGEGNTAVVLDGYWCDYRVAVKRLKTPISEDRLIADIHRFQKLHHPNLVLTLGACTNPQCVVQEFMDLGSLYDILHVHNIKLDTLLLLKMAKEFALVMNHLHTQKCTHGNVSSKYIFVDRHRTIRVGGLKLNSKDVYHLQSGQEKEGKTFAIVLNPRWRAPELTKGMKVITDKIDVFGYGLVLWEMVSNKIPFRKFDDVAAAAKVAYENLRPKIPGSCPRILRKLITRCWAPNPEERPTFSEVLKFFSHVEGKLFFMTPKSLWTLDREQEIEREKRRQEKFNEVVGFLKKRDIMLPFTELQLYNKIGEGSFAKVWEGSWGDYRVAVKKLKNPNITEKFFLREVANLQKSHHPNVVLFMGACVQPPCIVTEYMGGGSLYDVLHNNQVKLDIWVVIKFAKDIALGMQHLHSLNILHRDLTSKNILLDEYQNLKISDFGLSREVEVEMTLAGICNPRWRPPELTKGVTTYDGKVDVYCFGLVIFEMATGKIPFENLDSVTAAAKAAYEGHRPSIPLEVPNAVKDLICKCWAQEPDARPNFTEILEQLETIKKHLMDEYAVKELDDSSDESDTER